MFVSESICLSWATLFPGMVFLWICTLSLVSVVAVSLILGYAAAFLESKFLEGCRAVMLV